MTDAGVTDAGVQLACLPGAKGVTELPVVASEAAAKAQGLALVLDYFPAGLGLKRPEGRETPLVVDFTSGRMGWRLAHDRARHELVVKACGGVPSEPVPLVDATAGLGRDALVLACAGFQVTMMERHPVLAAMLSDGLSRLQRQQPLLAAQLQLCQGDAVELLQALPQRPNVVLLDPMFQPRQKKAAVKKELGFLQHLLAPPQPEEELLLLTMAMKMAKKRVVVKRPAKAATLASHQPGFHLAGKAVRFDVYPAA